MKSTILIVIFLSGFQVWAATPQEIIKQHQPQLQKFYRDLHENPELSGQEKRTAKKLADELRGLGIEVTEGIGGHGLVGIIRNGKGPVTLIRTDMDALPVTEDTGLAFKSKNQGVMHACGHDFHMAALVGTANVLLKSKDRWQGTIVLLGQPAEELVKGANAMIKDNLFKKIPKPDYVLALHAGGRTNEGKISIIPGYSMASVDSIDVTFKGKGTHGAAPESGIDPIMMATEYVQRIQTLITREKKATNPAVLTVGSIHGGTKNNIIPDEVKLQMTLRTYDPEVRKHLLKRVVELGKAIAKGANAPEEPVFAFPEASDATFNDVQLSQRIEKVFSEKLGKEVLQPMEPLMGSEDFGLFGKEVKAPSLMFFVGTGEKGKPIIFNHSAKYDTRFDKTSPLAIQAMSEAVMDLNKKSL